VKDPKVHNAQSFSQKWSSVHALDSASPCLGLSTELHIWGSWHFQTILAVLVICVPCPSPSHSRFFIFFFSPNFWGILTRFHCFWGILTHFHCSSNFFAKFLLLVIALNLSLQSQWSYCTIYYLCFLVRFGSQQMSWSFFQSSVVWSNLLWSCQICGASTLMWDSLSRMPQRLLLSCPAYLLTTSNYSCHVRLFYMNK